MNPTCPHCGLNLELDRRQCPACHRTILEPLELLEKLERKHASLHNRHGRELAAMAVELKQLRQLLMKKEELVPEVIEQVVEKEKVEKESLVQVSEEEVVVEHAEVKEKKKALPPEPQLKRSILGQKPVRIPRPSPRTKTWVEVQLNQLFTPLKQSYTRYREEGKLPIFFMTIAGIVAILFGFGYLMQYTLQALGKYEDLVKVGAGFAVAGMSVGIGFRLSRKGDRFQEYASGLISLGIILNYVMIYFLSDLGEFPTLSSTLIGFLLIVVNTGIAIYLALKFEVRLIAVLFLIGGALAPFYLNSTEDGTWYYLYLWCLTLAACFVSAKIQWKVLRYLAFVVSMLLVEVLVFSEAPSSLHFTTYYHLFAYLFLFYTFFDHGRLKTRWAKADILIFAANVSVFLWNLFSAYEEHLLTLGYLYLANALLLAIIFAYLKPKLPRKIQLGCFAIIGSLVGFAIPALFDQSLMGLFWSIEGVLLIYLGFLYRMEWVRKEGYLLLGIAFLKLGWQSLQLIYLWEQGIWHEGFLNYAIIGFLIAGCWIWGQTFKEEFVKFERDIFVVFREILPLWITSVFLIVAYQWMGSTANLLLWIPAIGMIYWGKRFDTLFTLRIGLFFYLLTLGILSFSSLDIAFKWESGIWHMGFLAYLVMGAMMIGFWLWGNIEAMKKEKIATAMWACLHEVVPVWLSSLFLILAYQWMGQYSWLIAWIPAIGMMYWGKRFDTKLTRLGGIVMYILALLILAFFSMEILTKWDLGIWHFGLLAYTTVGFLIAGFWLWGHKRLFEERKEVLYLWKVFRELTPLWLSSMFFLISWDLIGTWSFSLAWIPMLGLMYWGKQFNTQTSIFSGIFHLLFFLPAYFLSFSQTGSYHMSDQYWYAKIAMAGLLVSLWAIKSFYQWQKMQEEETFEIAQVFRILFFCLLPLIFIAYVKRHFIDWIAVAAWISILMTYALQKRLRYEALMMEVKVLAAGALFLTLWLMDVSGMCAGLLISMMLILLEKGDKTQDLAKSDYKALLQAIPFGIALLAGLLVWQLVPYRLVDLPYLCFSFILLIAVLAKDRFAVIQQHFRLALGLAASANVIGLGLTLLEETTFALVLGGVNLILWGWVLSKRAAWFPDYANSARWIVGLIVHQVQIVIAYVSILVLLNVPVEGPMLSVLLVLHAIILVFIAMKAKINLLNKVSISLFAGALLKVVLHDIRDFATAEKVAVLIIVGLLLLGGAYAYVRVKKYLERKEEELVLT
ncbi:MAG: DUF2339 domain-containing protein [Bacteroidota bacterium]